MPVVYLVLGNALVDGIGIRGSMEPGRGVDSIPGHVAMQEKFYMLVNNLMQPGIEQKRRKEVAISAEGSLVRNREGIYSQIWTCRGRRRKMRQGKDVILILSVMISVLMLFSATSAMAADWNSCIVGDNGYEITINNSTGKFPLVFTDNTLDINNYCGNTSMANYPCSVYKYKIAKKSGSAPTYNHLNYTIPFCPNGNINVLNSSPSLSSSCIPYTSSNTDTLIQNCGIQMGRFNALNSNGVNDVGSPPQDLFWIAVQGNVGLGVNSLFVYQSTSTQTNYPCSNGILGPGCYTPVPDPEPITCDPSFTSAKTTNICLPNVAGKVLKVDVFNKAIEAVYECPSADTGCTAPICIPGGEPACPPSPANYCVKQVTYEANAEIYDCSKCGVGQTCGVNCGRIGKECKLSHGKPDCEVVTDAGGSVEEAVGYIVVSEVDQFGVDHPTICLVGMGNAICYSR